MLDDCSKFVQYEVGAGTPWLCVHCMRWVCSRRWVLGPWARVSACSAGQVAG